jgi:hypothetical protein
MDEHDFIFPNHAEILNNSVFMSGDILGTSGP